MTAVTGPEVPDLVDRIQAEWAKAYPEFDMRPIGILGCIQHIATASSHHLEYDVLGALTRSPRPLRASEVVSTTMLSGASITKITENLARRGLLVRRKSERDGRVVLLEPTDAGRALVDAELPRRLADDEVALSGLTAHERESLTVLLRKVSAAVHG